jgi:hypothetical protein
MIRPWVLLACACLAGCVSVPLSTMVRMSTFDEQDFAALDPDVVRVRITLPRAFVLDTRKSWLGVNLASSAGVHEGKFELSQVAVQPAVVPGGLFAPDEPGTEYTLRLAEHSRAPFKELQGFVKRGRPEQVTIRVVPILSSFPEDAASVDVWIDLLLSADAGFFTLLKGARVPMEQIRAASAAARD